MYKCPECAEWFEEFASPDNRITDPQDYTDTVHCPECNSDLTKIEVYEGDPCEECDEPRLMFSHLCTYHQAMCPPERHPEMEHEQRLEWASKEAEAMQKIVGALSAKQLFAIRMTLQSAYLLGNGHGYREACREAFPNGFGGKS